MNSKSIITLVCAFFGTLQLSQAGCPTLSQNYYNQSILQVTAGQNGVQQKVGYFRISGSGDGSSCDFAFLIDDLGKVYYSTLLTALSSGQKIDFWAYANGANGDIWLPGNSTAASGHSAATINIHQ